MVPSANIFQSISGDAVPSQIPRRDNHPQARIGILDSSRVIQTNKFYANLFLGSRADGVWTHPYSISWSQGRGNARSWGLAISHIDRDMLALGPDTGHGSRQYYINPIGIQSMLLSAAELSNSTSMTVDSLQTFSANMNLAPTAGASPIVTFPLVQGMGFVTGVYKGATPLVQTSVFFRTVRGPIAVGSTSKWQVTLEDGKSWLVYATPDAGYAAPALNMTSNTTLRGPPNWRGTIMVAKNPAGNAGESIFDTSAGAYPVAAIITGSVSGGTGSYSLQFGKAGLTSKTLLMWALPHHVQSFDSHTAPGRSNVQLYTTTKGLATAVRSDFWTMVESNLPTSMGFAPWTPSRGAITTLSSTATRAVSSAAESELRQDIDGQTNLNSMYFSGKGLAKFASIVYAANDLAKNQSVARPGLDKLKKAFAVFVNNRQIYPLVYDSTWGGVVSSAGYQDANADFGNAYYNDHHFHYGYFVYTAAVIGYLDPSWLNTTNKAWVNMLVKDFANPIQGGDFPFSRAFDWFHGHSWAKGLFASADGKDQESTSEDAFATYGMKMWGRVIGDANMEARGNLMLALQARSFQNYFLMESNNRNQPAEIINNKVTGILFENKVDWATYFSAAWWCKEGIHMIPVHVPSTLIRTPNFVREEFNTYMSNGRINEAEGGWRGILYANLALIDPRASYDFFANPGFDMGLLDGGASRTWYLAYAAALGGA
ncbi:glycoside hydrolase family 81 protein [Aplosporella prunicola CBS 121167]|uniref:Glucan endo-1,3-beta-D-glucosidase 1 n=1 Tax=Aplosporella prunicola CBS 121167 TaxID=1176127 RepID=A0A6A6B0B6_9PEZI|nr:glycoside hydrolase family 81 protein [Aplosporella prunicola CBS 121167]KAF2137622.1 glycoside hydrolase family 81 protein [Aplosporella prunicola CBS 121167]